MAGFKEEMIFEVGLEWWNFYLAEANFVMQNIMEYLGNKSFQISEGRNLSFKNCFDQGTQNLKAKWKS